MILTIFRIAAWCRSEKLVKTSAGPTTISPAWDRSGPKCSPGQGEGRDMRRAETFKHFFQPGVSEEMQPGLMNIDLDKRNAAAFEAQIVNIQQEQNIGREKALEILVWGVLMCSNSDLI